MNWNKLNTLTQIPTLIEESNNKPILIFKHSTRCSVSSMALSRLERSWENNTENVMKPYYLDLIQFREISNLIAEQFGVVHESPQIILLYKGKSVFSASHMNINLPEIISNAKFVS